MSFSMAQRGRNKLSRLRRRGEFGRRVKPLQLGPNQTGGSSDLVSPIYHANFSSFFTIQPTGRGTYIEVATPSLDTRERKIVGNMFYPYVTFIRTRINFADPTSIRARIPFSPSRGGRLSEFFCDWERKKG